MNRKRSFYNISIGIGSQILSIVLGIVIPKLFLLNYGSEVNGFLNTITQIFAYFALLEAGVGAATLQALYGPVAKNLKNEINQIIVATDQYYRKTGKFYLLAVIILAIVYPLVINSKMNKLTMVLIILFNGIPGVISYYYQGKFTLLLSAEGRNYIITALTSITSTVISFLKIAFMLLGFDILTIQFTYLIVNLIKILILGLYIKKNYSWICLNVEPNFEAIGQKNSAFVSQICDLIFRNTDTIILSIFCGLKVVSVYAMYTLLFSMVRTALDYVAQGFSFIMGQAYNQGIEYYIKLHDLYESYRMAFIFALYNIAYIFILPFMKLYTEGVEDVNYIDHWVVILFTVYYLMTGARACCSDLIGYAQHFKLTQTRCIIEAIINLMTSIIAVYFLGIYGALIGTIVALLYRMNDMIIYANKKILNRGTWMTYRRVISNAVLFVLISWVAGLIPWQLDSYRHIILWAGISGIFICAIYFGVASIVNTESFKLLLKFYVKPMLKKVGILQ
ncbi:sugar isomerase [Sellimonas catena]|uniref:Oligosaccharide transporter n=1 Tax=Sellimonas catena TaxID=2994035 RepID=A0A9W6FH72_9FIRM|nr:sugar isomerase [Sellimonas catena]GLG91686.1 oligosaccharide transporter [Sellimonas catena]